jgi:topoisomerase-4 subunit B
VVDCGAFEALAGHCQQINVTLLKDGSLQVTDDGPGMPLEIVPREHVSVLELLLTTLPAGAATPAYGLALVNALSSRLECRVRRGGEEYSISFRDSELHSKLTVTDSIDMRTTGTTVRFWPDPAFFGCGAFCVADLRHMLRTKAALCTGLRITFSEEATGEQDSWRFSDDLRTYLTEQLGHSRRLPAGPITGGCHSDDAVIDYALTWTLHEQAPVRESYADLVPTPRDSPLVDGLRAGAARAVRQFGETHDLAPRDTQLAIEDIWERASFVVSARAQGLWARRTCFMGMRMADMTSMERLAEDSVSRWMNLHPGAAERIVRIALAGAQGRACDGR